MWSLFAPKIKTNNMAKTSGRCHSSYLLCIATWMTYFFLGLIQILLLYRLSNHPGNFHPTIKMKPILCLQAKKEKKNPKDNSRWWNTEKIIFTSRHTQWLLHPLTYIPAFSTTLTNHLQLHADWITLPPSELPTALLHSGNQSQWSTLPSRTPHALPPAL